MPIETGRLRILTNNHCKNSTIVPRRKKNKQYASLTKVSKETGWLLTFFFTLKRSNKSDRVISLNSLKVTVTKSPWF
jgi:hypothetical protein